MQRILAILLFLFLFSGTSLLWGQTLTISNSGQTGSSGTNWSISGGVLRVNDGNAEVNTSTIEGHLASNNLIVFVTSTNSTDGKIIISNELHSDTTYDLVLKASNDIEINADITRSGSGGLTLKTGSGFVTGTGKLVLDSGSFLALNHGANIANDIEISSGTLTVKFADFEVEYLVVAGGGSGGFRHGAGGGAGGMLEGSLDFSPNTEYTITVGKGANGSSSSHPNGYKGDNSSISGSDISSVNAIGGGGGISYDTNGNTEEDGGSGGGGAYPRNSNLGGDGTLGQGHNGGVGGVGYNHGGGGGAGELGENGTSNKRGNGGDGKQSSINGSLSYYAGGGGGGTHNPAPSNGGGLGGQGGGGDGGTANINSPGISGTPNTGGGGGGASTYDGGNSSGGAGGSGVIYLRYLGQSNGTGGTISSGTNLANGYTLHSFTSTGSSVISTSTFSSTISGDIIGSGGVLINANDGEINLTGNNTYEGNTSIDNGIVNISNSGNLSNSAALTISSGSILNINNANIEVKSISGTGTIQTSTAGSKTIKVSGSESTIFSGIIQNGSGSLGVIKSGTGTLTLTNNNTFSGSTTISDGTLVLKNDAPNPTSKTISGTGKIIIEPSSTSFSSAFSNSGWTFNNTLGGLTIGTASNTADITIATDIEIAGPISVYGGDITVSGNITSTLSGADVLLKASKDISLAENKSIGTNTGNLILWSNSDGENENGSILLRDGSSVNTNGGHLWMGGGSGSINWNDVTVGNGFAVSGTSINPSNGDSATKAGVYLENFEANTSGGDISIFSQSDDLYAFVTHQDVILDSGPGKIFLKGIAESGGNRGGVIGIHDDSAVFTLSSSNSSTHAIEIIFDTELGSEHGATLQGENNFIATNGGISFTSLGDTDSGDYGLRLGYSTSDKGILNFLSSTGTITIDLGANGYKSESNSNSSIHLGAKSGTDITSSSSNVVFKSDRFTLGSYPSINALNFNTTGEILIAPSSTSFSNEFELSDQWSFSTNASKLTIGNETNTSEITINSDQTVNGPISIYGGNITLSNSLTASGALLLQSSGAVTQAAAVSATALSLQGSGTFTLNNANNHVNTLTAGTSTQTTGNISFTNKDALAIGDGSNGVLSTGTISIGTLSGNLTITEDIETNNNTNSAIKLFADMDTAAPNLGNGNIIISETLTLTTGSGGRVSLFSGKPSSSDGLVNLVGEENIRIGVDSSTTSISFEPALNAGAYALFRTGPIITFTENFKSFAISSDAASAPQSMVVSATGLTADVTLTAPTGFELSGDGSGYSDTLSLDEVSGSLTNTTVYVRVKSTASGYPTGTISLTTTGATPKGIAVKAAANAALHFDGVNDYVEVDALAANLNSDFTISFWVNVEEYRDEDSYVFSVNTSRNGNRFLIGIDNIDHRPIFHYYEGGENSIAIGDENIIDINEWYNFSLSKSGSEYKFYLNGILLKTFSASITVYDSDKVSLGQEFDSSGITNELFGKIDELRIWNKALSQEEIEFQMFETLQGNESGLLAYYNFNDGVPLSDNTSNTTLSDLAGSANGTLNGFDNRSSTTATTSTWVAHPFPEASLESGYTKMPVALWQAIGIGNTRDSNGLSMSVGTALTEANYANFASNSDTGTTTTDVPVTDKTRSQRIWYVNETGVVTATVSIGVASATGQTASAYKDPSFSLLYRAGTSGAFSQTQTGTLSGDVVTFVNEPLQDGFYALGIVENISLTPSSTLSKTFGETDPTFTYTTSPDVALSGVLSRTAGENVGTYSLSLGTISSTQYSITLVATDFEITKATPVITISNISKSYGDANFTLTPTSTSTATFSFASSDSLIAAVSGETVTIKKPGTVSITISQPENQNYKTGTKTISLSIDSPASTSGLITHYDFNNNNSFGSGSATINDLTSVNNDGVFYGTSFTASTTSYLNINDNNESYVSTSVDLNPNLFPANTSTAISVFLWVYPTENGVILTETNTNPPGTSWHDSQIEWVNNKVVFATWHYGAPFFTKDAPLNRWYYVGFTHTGTQMKAYVNGEQVGEPYNHNRLTPYNDGGNTSLLYALGYRTITNLGSTTSASFRLGEFQVYNKALTYAEISDNFNNTKPIYIDRIDPNVSFNDITATFGDSNINLTHSSLSSGTVSFTISDTSIASITGTNTVQILKSGTTSITLSQQSTSGYYDTTKSANLVVNTKTVTVTLDDKAKKNREADPTLTYTSNPVVNTSLPNSSTITFTGTITRTAGEAVGTYSITQGTLTNTNYNIVFIPGTFTISPTVPDINGFTDLTLTYGDANVSRTYTSTSTGTPTYTISNTNVATINSSTGSITTVGVGTTTVWLSLADDGTYEPGTASMTLTVAALPMTVTADLNQTKVYGENDPTFSYAFSPSGPLTNTHTVSFTGTLTRTTNDSSENAGTYSITIGELTNTNYSISYVGADFRITPKTLTISGIRVSDKVYDGTDEAAVITSDISYDELAFSDVLSVGSTGVFSDKHVGQSKTVTLTTTFTGAALGNYNIVHQPTATASITAKTVTATLTGPISKVYNGTVSATLSDSNYLLGGFVSGESATITQTYGTYDTKEIGSSKEVRVDLTNAYAPVSGTLLSNYILPGTVSNTVGVISAQTLTITAVNKSKVYDSAVYTPTDYTVGYDGFVNSETKSVLSGTLTFTGTALSATTSGTYVITPGGLSSSNYSITYVSGVLSITQRDMSEVGVSAINDLVYTGAPQTVSPIVTFNGQTLTLNTDYTKSFKSVFGNSTLSSGATCLTSGPLWFTPTTSGYITQIELNGFGAGETASLAVKSDYCGTALLLGTSNNITMIDGWNTWIFSSPIQVTANTTYYITSDDASACLGVRWAQSGDDPTTGNVDTMFSCNNNNNDVASKITVTTGNTNVGTASITLTGIGNYKGERTVGFTITSKTLTITADDQSKVYDSAVYTPTDYTVSYDGFVNSETNSVLSSTLTYTGTALTATASGTYVITPEGFTSSNYSITYVSGVLSITQKPITIAITDQTKIYGASDPSPLNAHTISVGSVYGQNPTGVFTRTLGEDVGTYTISNDNLTYGNNYIETFVNGGLTITARTITVTAAAKTKVFGESDPELTYTATPAVGDPVVAGSAATVTFTGTLTRTAGENAGTYSITLGTLTNTNYSIDYVGGDFSIIKAPTDIDDGDSDPATETLSDTTITFGDADLLLTPSSSNTADYTFTSSDSNVASITTTSTNTASIRNMGVGSAVITISQAADTNYQGKTVSYTLTVDPLAVTLTPTATQSKTYGEADLTLTYATSPELSSPLNNSSTVTFTGVLSKTAGTNVGTYSITIGTLTNTNYALTFTETDYTINRRPITISAGAKTKVYGSADPSLTYTLTAGSIVSGDSATGVLTRTSGEAAGTYTITQNTLTYGNNYNETYQEAYLTITNATVTLTVADYTKVYDKQFIASSNLSFTANGLVNGDIIDNLVGTPEYSISGTATNTVGTYSVTLSGLSHPSYNVVFVGGNASITPATLTITADTLSKTYGDIDPALTHTTTGLISGDTATGTLTRTAGENVGTYSISNDNLTYGNNYTENFVSGTLTITTKAVTVTADTKTKNFGDVDPSFTYTSNPLEGSSLSNGDTIAFTGTLSRTVGENAGTYSITLGTLTNTNFTISFLSNNLLISQITPTITFNDHSKVFGDANFEFSKASNSTGQISYTIANTQIASEVLSKVSLIAYEGFDYNSGIPLYGLNGGTGFSEAWDNTQKSDGDFSNNRKKHYVIDFTTDYYGVSKLVNRSSMTYPGINNIGYYLSDDGLQTDVLKESYRNLNETISEGIYYVQFLVQFYNNNRANYFKLKSNDNDQLVISGRDQKIQMSKATNSSGLDIVDSGVSLKLAAESQLIIVQVDYNLNITKLWVDPDLENFDYEEPPAHNASLNYSFEFNRIELVSHTPYGHGLVGTQFDEISIFKLSDNFIKINNIGSTTVTLSQAADTNYLSATASMTLTITPLSVTVTPTANQSKTYGDTEPIITYGFAPSTTINSSTITFTGTLSRTIGENAGTYPVNIGTLTNTNYTINLSSESFDINTKTLTATLIGAVDKIYNGTTSATLSTANYELGGFVSGESATITQTFGTYDTKHIGTSKEVTVSLTDAYAADSGTLLSNYSLAATATGTVGSITAKTLTVTNITVLDKVYDGSTNSSVNSSTIVYNGLEPGDDFAIQTTAGVFDNENVGVNKTVSLTNTYSGVDLSNYSLVDQASATASITAKTITATLIGTVSKTYNRTLSATLAPSHYQLFGFVGSESATITQTVGNYDTKNVGTNKEVTVSLTNAYAPASGTLLSNYALAATATGTVGEIIPKSIDISRVTASDKQFDNTTSATVSSSTMTYTGLIGDEVIEIIPSGTFVDAAVGADKTVNLTYSFSGAASGNYTNTGQLTTTASILANDNVLDFDGSDDYIRLASGIASPFNLGTRLFTIETWVKFKTVGTQQLIYSARNLSQNSDRFVLFLETSKKLRFYMNQGVSNSASTDLYSENQMDADQWYHVAVVRRSDFTYELYINGEFQDSSTITGSSDKSIDIDGHISIGNYFFSDFTSLRDFFNGQLDEFRLWTTPKSQTEIQDNINKKMTGSEANLSVYYSFDQGVSGGNNTGIASVLDGAGTAHAAINGFTKTGTSSNFVANDRGDIKVPPTLTLTGTSKVYGDADFALSVSSTSTGTISYTSSNISVATIDAATGSITITGVGTTTITASQTETTKYTSATATASVYVAPKPISFSGITASDKVYDGTTTAATATNTLIFTGLVGSDEVLVNPSGTFDNANVGVSKIVSLTYTYNGSEVSRYAITGQATTTASITAKPITIIPTASQSKTYGVADATLSYTISPSTLPDGTAISLGGTLSRTLGENVGNYSITIGTVSNTNYDISLSPETFEITKKTITVSGITANDKVYDANTTASVDLSSINFATLSFSDTILATVIGTFDTKDIGTGKTVNLSATYSSTALDNYTIIDQATTTASITAKTVSVTGNTGVDKTYDQTTNLPLGEIGYGSLSGVIGSEDVSLTGVGVYDAVTAGARSVQIGTVTLTGADKDNYSLLWINGSGSISKKTLTVTANNDAKFVGETDTTGYNGVSYSGFEGADSVADINVSGLALSRTNSSQNNAGSYPGTLVPSGVTATNYTLNYVGGDYTIIPADKLLLRVYNQTTTYGTAASYTITSAQYFKTGTGLVNLNVPTPVSGVYPINDGASTINIKIVPDSPVNSSASKLSVGSYGLAANVVSGSSGNFSNNIEVTGNHTVAKQSLTASASSVSKEYNATTAMAGVRLSLATLETGDLVSVNGTGSFSSPNVGTGLSYTIAGLSLAGADADNYYLSAGASFSGANGVITKAPLTVTANNDNGVDTDPAYSGGNGVTYQGFKGADSVSDLGGTLSYTGTSQGATAAGTYVIEPTGITSSNYSITFVTGSLTIIVGDSDGDGVRDPLDNCPTVANASQADADGDGIGDVCDNAPNTPNADQRDTDGDGIGDVLDTDDDNDGCQDTSDAFPLDPSECSDNDGDGTGDNADTDDDNDGVPDSIDNCPFTPNTNQSDIDSDGIGDVCDNDIDGDGWSNEQEQACGSDATEATDTLTDFDNDGLPDCSDPDDDNDGFEDQNDAFPLDATEWLDTDADGIGNNTDEDDDNDGQSDAEETFCGTDPLDASSFSGDVDGDGVTDCRDTDNDNDGVNDSNDAFPLDPSEWTDTDADGIGNNADTDDDNDGFSDLDELECNSDPLDKEDLPADLDQDGIPDCKDTDLDGDGCLNTQDVFPRDPSECIDTDGDGLGDNVDVDNDNDGVIDSDDAFPLDPNESKDSDNDGIGDNADLDDNNDGFDDEKVVVSGLLTPNSSGMERTWKIVNIDQYPTSRVSVFDKNGLEVFSAQNYRNDWSGTYKNTTNPLPAGSYIYRLSLGDGNPAKEGWIYIQY